MNVIAEQNEAGPDATGDWLDSPAVTDVLSHLCLDCARYAHLYQALDEGPKTRAEDEQAFMLRKWLKLAREHGDNWRNVYRRELESLIKRVKAKKAEMDGRVA